MRLGLTTKAVRVFAAWRKRLGLMLIAVLFVCLGYVGMTVMKNPYQMPHSKAAREALPPHHEDNTQGEAVAVEETMDAGHLHAAPMVLLVLSSMPRGGSTLLIDLLSNIQDSVVLFEPLWLIEKTNCYKDEACVNRYLADVFSCSFSQEFEDWLKGKGLFFRFFNQQARDCLKKRNEAKAACLKEMNLRALCEAAPFVLVKVIRDRLAWMHNMLEDSLINLKVIHLIRDPRGSLNSIRKFGWDSDPHSRCSDLQGDIKAYEKIKKVFPSKVMQVQYERLCLSPKDITKDIFRFLFNNSTLPDRVNTFVEQHMLAVINKKSNSMSTFKNSSEEFQAWRYKIPEDYLKAIEAEDSCLYSIQHMGHALFGSEAAAKDLTRPLFNTT